MYKRIVLFSAIIILVLSGCSSVEGVSSSNLRETQEFVSQIHPFYLSESEMTEIETQEIIYDYFDIIGNEEDITEQEKKMFDTTKNLIIGYELILFKDILEEQYELGKIEYEKSKSILENEFNISFEVSDE